MWFIIKLIGGWLISLAWKAFWKKPIDWGSKLKNLIPTFERLRARRERRRNTDPEAPAPDGTDRLPGWRLRRLFKRLG